MQRLFIAFPIASEAAREIERVQHILEEQNTHAPITWTRTQPHCTLVFLGDCDEATTALLKEKLPTLAGSGTIPARLGSLGAFPNPHRPRVLIARIDDVSGEIGRLYERVIRIVDPIAPRDAGLQDDRGKQFVPHVTLGRVKQDGVRVLGLDTPIELVAFEVSKVVLFASELLPRGPRHTVLLNVILERSEAAR